MTHREGAFVVFGFSPSMFYVPLSIPGPACQILPPGNEVEKQGFRKAWLVTGQKFQGLGLKLTAVILTFRDLASHLWQNSMKIAR